jgi:hypothetical protein
MRQSRRCARRSQLRRALGSRKAMATCSHAFEREKGSETGFYKGRRITRGADILAGFENPDPRRHATCADTK